MLIYGKADVNLQEKPRRGYELVLSVFFRDVEIKKIVRFCFNFLDIGVAVSIIHQSDFWPANLAVRSKARGGFYERAGAL
jgi:hypothetical protein